MAGRVLFLFIFLGCLTYVGIQLINPYKLRHLRVWLSKYYIVLWILTSIAFGLMHVNNYVTVFTLNLPLLILILPRIIAGFVFGYVKIKNKQLCWSVAAHMVNNAIPVVILLFFHLSLIPLIRSYTSLTMPGEVLSHQARFVWFWYAYSSTETKIQATV